MSQNLAITLGQHSIAGTKPDNDDFYGAITPQGNALDSKGIAVVIADGVSASEGGKEASQVAVKQFLSDYYSTPDSWTVKTAINKVVGALNLWLCSQGQRQYGGTGGMSTTFSCLILKSHTAYLAHVGDSRIYRWQGGKLECLSKDHRVHFSGERSYLTRALGLDTSLEMDFRVLELQQDDVFILSTDGVHDVLPDAYLAELLRQHGHDPQQCAEHLVETALQAGSQDNITCQVVRIGQLPEVNREEFYQQLGRLPFPPDLKAGQTLDGYRILRELNATSRSQVYLAEDTLEAGNKVVIKTPSQNFNDDPAYIDLFLHEEWVARRLNSPHLIKLHDTGQRQQTFLYSVVEYVEGQTLRQWMRDNPDPSVTQVRATVDQIARGLRAMHRLEMIHQDLKPDNILIDQHNTLKIIDFGSTRIAGLLEIQSVLQHNHIVGTASYSAPEYFKGARGTNRSDIFSLGVIAYEMFTGQLPFGEIEPERAHKKKFQYTSACLHNPKVPEWVDAALEKAAHPNPNKRYDLLSEFVADLTKPNDSLLASRQNRPLLERNPLLFWKWLAALEAVGILLLAYQLLH
ncbi:bifunctional protein-serine/threonine kinase/phosphatase [Candidatus Thiothrix sp. Deng01]|uniref:Bifunctional protein-serine/threonine kinase/phosphatase n=1 Tax=Candidatus Thiothrix phosphatis TaxID=3112415 RepID=A0ABU6D276_9GAMM|nr:bifunctional protein-serine/threonine kinase/phosphatase [Candidatus Thiothrix sp. Deng01]MEB4592477.1 bifunctional protein-serine/threonine kinase/phosphatase [Candidatus Thiothrix sp. Deng01]